MTATPAATRPAPAIGTATLIFAATPYMRGDAGRGAAS
ncbi:MAG: hypothetical protein ACJAVR_003144 [Paracoccaceae bacterium]|jgi:hypothetical protein